MMGPRGMGGCYARPPPGKRWVSRGACSAGSTNRVGAVGVIHNRDSYSRNRDRTAEGKEQMSRMAVAHTAPHESPRLVSVEEAARLLGIGKSLAWEMVYAQQIKTVRLGKRVLVPLAEIDRIARGA